MNESQNIVVEVQADVIRLLEILSKARFSLQDEKKLQTEIESKLAANSIIFDREYRLDKVNIPDFMIGNIAIEVKIKGRASDIYSQLSRYSKFDQVQSIILLTNRSIGFPEHLNGKPIYILKLGKAWL